MRLGVPEHVSGHSELMRNPIHATGVGLLQYGRHARLNPQIETSESVSDGGTLRRFVGWIRSSF